MVDVNRLKEEVIASYREICKENYRLLVFIVGPPGSGKSTIAEKLKDAINTSYLDYLKEIDRKTLRCENYNHSNIDQFVQGIEGETISSALEDERHENFDSVENVDFICKKKRLKDGSYTITGRGGQLNAIKVRQPTSQEKNLEGNTSIAEVLPMDGFHLSRECLDHFSDPQWAHLRRGSSLTFDSNNFLKLCEIMAKTSRIFPSIGYDGDDFTAFDAISSSFDCSVPSVEVPGFDHSLKDPQPSQHTISFKSRIVIFEGLYLLYNKENWSKIYNIVSNSNAKLFYKILACEDQIESRVAKRHLKAGLVASIEDGKDKFRKNDLLNARDIEKNSISSEDIRLIRND